MAGAEHCTVQVRIVVRGHLIPAHCPLGLPHKLPTLPPTKPYLLRGDDADAHGALLPDAVVAQQLLHLVEPAAELAGELVDVAEQADGQVLRGRGTAGG